MNHLVTLTEKTMHSMNLINVRIDAVTSLLTSVNQEIELSKNSPDNAHKMEVLLSSKTNLENLIVTLTNHRQTLRIILKSYGVEHVYSVAETLMDVVYR